MQDKRYMKRAIELATRGGGNAAPNPMVGAVLVHEGRIIGEGWHAAYGKEHAEVACLNSVAPHYIALIPDSTMYVTLEPCAHQGKQPPCAHRLVKEGIKRVMVATEDPFPHVKGRGISILRDAGVEVSVGTCEAEARWMSRRFLCMQEKGRPYIILKWAASADGFMAPAGGGRMQLSNKYSHALVHKWRTEEAAITVGYNTALVDNPQLTARAWDGPQPLRIAIDRQLELPATHYLLDNSTPTWIINDVEDAVDHQTHRIRIPYSENMLPSLMERLRDSKKISLFVEGGAALLNGFIKQSLWDEARVFTTSHLLGTGIRAPQLLDSSLVLRAAIKDDILNVYQANNANYPYPAGALL